MTAYLKIIFNVMLVIFESESVKRCIVRSSSKCDVTLSTDCPRLKVRNGYFVLKEGDNPSELPKMGVNSITAPGQVVNITCKPGFQVMGEETVTCLANGRYDKPLGVCVRARK